jgi:hypothetical protein
MGGSGLESGGKKYFEVWMKICDWFWEVQRVAFDACMDVCFR